MRPLEIGILVLNLVVLLALSVPLRPAPRWPHALPTVIVALTLAHLLSGQYRWQMVPSYVLTGTLFALTLPSLLRGSGKPRARSRWAFVVGGVAFLWWLTAAGLPVILPVPRLPTPPGPYAVGSVLFDWTDPTRAEIYSADPEDHRELMVQIWYPAQPVEEGEGMPYLDHADAALPAFAQILHLPPFALDHLRQMRTHTYAEAPMRSDGAPYPVVLYSHGYTSYRTASLAQMEALASAGYIAVSIDHAYAAAFTVFPDGRVVVNDPALLPPAGRNQPGDQEAREELQATIVADQRFVMDQLELLNAGQLDPHFADKLDLGRIGWTGVSLGGGAIVWTCHLDARCKAGLAQDGWYEPLPETVVGEPLRQPFLFMQSETRMWEMDNLTRLNALYRGVDAPAYHLRLTGVLHADFGDYPLLTPLHAPLMFERGRLSGERTLQVVDAYLLAFFDQYLKNEPSPLLEGSSPDYPEVSFDFHSP